MKTRALLTAIITAASLHVITRAQGQLVPGRNINMNPGTTDQYVGDIYHQRQVETKIVCTIPQHCAAISNDYRTVDGAADLTSGFGEGQKTPANALRTLAEVLGLAKRRDKQRTAQPAAADAWLGLYRTSNLENWQNGLVPGFPQDSSDLGSLPGIAPPWRGLTAASDGDLATDGTYIYGVGLFFNRGGASMIGAFRLTDYNNESALPIRWDQNGSRLLDQRPSPATLSFVDLPSVTVDPTPRGDSTPGCGHVYIGYTAFTGTAGDSAINVVRSFNCGQSYVGVNNTATPIKINGSFKKNQRVVFAVNPKPGTPLTTGGGSVYAIWRTFSPDMIVGSASFDFGKTWTAPVPYSVLNGFNTLCTYDQPTIGSNPAATLQGGYDLADPANDTARAVAFPSATIDSNGKIYLVWAERVSPSGNAVTGSACNTGLQPKIVLTTSVTGLSWSPRKAIDIGARCETTATTVAPGGLDQSVPNGTIATCPSGTVGRLSGPQLQPVISHSAGKVMVMYKEGRGGLNTTGGSPANGYHAGRDRQMDVRAAQINPGTNALASTTQVSVYTYSAANNDVKRRDGATNPPNAKAVNLPYLLQYSGGTNPFMGDHDALAPAEPVVWDSPARAPTAADVPSTRFLGTWGGDNREAFFPGGDLFNTLGWTQYTDYLTSPNSCNQGIRNSNDYLSSIGSGTEAYVHQSFKPANGLFQRSWVVTVRNRRNFTQAYRFALDERAGMGSFDEAFASDPGHHVIVIGNNNGNALCVGKDSNGNDLFPYPGCTAYRTIAPYSSMTFTVFGHITDANAAAPIRVNIFEAALSGPIQFATPIAAVPGATPAAIVRLNPNPTQPVQLLAGQGAADSEHHGPDVTGPVVTTYPNPGPGNPGPGNPTESFPGPGNPGPLNPGPGNPGPGNPGPGNAGFGDYTDYTFTVTASGANTISQYATFADIANAAGVDQSHLVQMLITREHKIPTLDENCVASERKQDELISLINARTAAELGVPGPGNPGPGNPGPGNTTAQNPGPGNPGPGNNTFAVSPANQALSAAGPAAFLARAVASASAMVVSDQAADKGPDGTLTALPDMDDVKVTFRFHHCEPVAPATKCTINGVDYTPDSRETVPRTADAGGNHLIGFTVAPGGGENNNDVITPPSPVTAGQDLLVSAPDVLTASPNQGTAGTRTTVGSFTITNAGNADAGPFSYRYFLLPSEGPGAPVPLTESIPVPVGDSGFALRAGQSMTIASRIVTIPPDASAGSKRIRVVVDDTNAVRETDETNNTKSAPFSVVAVDHYQVGDLMAGTGAGIIKHFRLTHDNAGDHIVGVDSHDTGTACEFQTGMAFKSNGNLLATMFDCTARRVTQFNNAGASPISFGSGFDGAAESVTIDATGSVYVGQVDGAKLLKFDGAGNLITTFSPGTENRGADWIDLASDQCTLYYTSEDGGILRFNVCTGSQLMPFAAGGNGARYALRIRSNGDVLVAASSKVERYNASGQVIQTYDRPQVTDSSYFFSLALDADGQHFWVGSFASGKLYRFDITSGSSASFDVGLSPGNILGGLAVFGEPVVGR
jgi:hypothetical protein